MQMGYLIQAPEIFPLGITRHITQEEK